MSSSPVSPTPSAANTPTCAYCHAPIFSADTPSITPLVEEYGLPAGLCLRCTLHELERLDLPGGDRSVTHTLLPSEQAETRMSGHSSDPEWNPLSDAPEKELWQGLAANGQDRDIPHGTTPDAARPTAFDEAEEMEIPPFDTLMEWMVEGDCEALDGCIVEPDGRCPHGAPSWLLHLGMI